MLPGGLGRRWQAFESIMLLSLESYMTLAQFAGADAPGTNTQELSTGWVAKVAIRSATSARTRLQRHPRRRCVGTALPEEGRERVRATRTG